MFNTVIYTEFSGLMNIAERFMLFAESKAFRGQKMTMEELSFKLNTLLAANDYPVLYEYKKYLRATADKHAKAEYKKHKAALPKGDEKYKKPLRPEGDFDETMKKIAKAKPPKKKKPSSVGTGLHSPF